MKVSLAYHIIYRLLLSRLLLMAAERLIEMDES